MSPSEVGSVGHDGVKQHSPVQTPRASSPDRYLPSEGETIYRFGSTDRAVLTSRVALLGKALQFDRSRGTGTEAGR
jgi:hypothetical protein